MSLSFVALFLLLISAKAMDNLMVAFQWRKLDFHFASDEERQTARHKGFYIDSNNIPMGIEVSGDRLFITVPRWRGGVAASLGYIKLTDSMDSPKLYPYPSWEAHIPREGQPKEIVSPFRLRADKCGRLWVMDSGYENILEENVKKSKPKLLVYDLRTDKLIRSYEIPDNQTHPDDTFFCNVVVEENNCHDSFAYLADLGHPALVVYSYEANASWVVKHHYFSLDPLTGNMTVGGENFQWSDGLFGMALAKQPNGYSTLFFHPMMSFNEFTVSTMALRDKTLATNQSAIYHKFKVLGTRGAKGQSGSSFYHEKSKVLFYSLLNLDAVACWRTTNPNYTIQSQGRIYMSHKTMVFPSDLKVDTNDTLWVMSNQLPVFMYNPQKMEEDYQEYHYRILKSSVADAIRDTSCDSKMVIKTTANTQSGSGKIHAGISVFVVLLLTVRR